MRRVASVLVLMLAACSSPQDPAPAASGTSEQAEAAVPQTSSAPDQFSGTAWRAIAEDGARYTTYFDPGGRYRDLRNGEPWQEGSWAFNDVDGRQICFTPDGENTRETCWEPGAMDGEALFASNETQRIRLERVDYSAPEVPEDDPVEDAEAPA
ncbi:hypothetical protein E3U23_08330 [Erythrobacter litoralis]|uniref:hypothetical protein n=1 Tax=Erythrobacter litoralis TaxID=39960 RepID=UPI002435EF40|nr:hypothetical protein [Erythrobacter litoralis]MDG6079199.1 hypothetical protein [Erythrobacter litoralis]